MNDELSCGDWVTATGYDGTACICAIRKWPFPYAECAMDGWLYPIPLSQLRAVRRRVQDAPDLRSVNWAA